MGEEGRGEGEGQLRLAQVGYKVTRSFQGFYLPAPAGTEHVVVSGQFVQLQYWLIHTSFQV